MPTQTPAEVPAHGDPDRKRVLNVLAQRRYRQRRREKIRILEQQIRQGKESPTTETSDSDGVPILTPESCELGDGQHGTHDRSSQFQPNPTTTLSILEDPALQLWPNSNTLSFNLDPLAAVTAVGGLKKGNDIVNSSLPSHDLPTWEEVSASGSNASNWTEEQQSWFDPCSAMNTTMMFPLTNDQNFDVPVLKSIRAGVILATLLDCTDSLYDPFALRVLNESTPSIDFASLPPALRPVNAQRTIPHHPVLDIIPWASARTKIICMFALPEAARPPIARGETPVLTLITDLDDSEEPSRFHGDNESDENNWELGEPLFRNWWWAFDNKVIQNTNRLRALRGVPRLQLKPPS